MTAAQIALAIKTALDELDFSEHDFVHQLALVSEDAEVGLEEEEVESEIVAILEDNDIGTEITNRIKEALVTAFL